MRIRTVAGRSFEYEDNAGAPPRVVLSESLAQRLFHTPATGTPGGAAWPIGRRVRVGTNGPEAEVIGVVSDVKHRALDEGLTPTVYQSAPQAPSRSSVLVVRSTQPDADTAAVVRDEVARLDRLLPVYGIRGMQERVDQSPGVPERRLLTAAFAAFALLAVVLSAIGLFGVVAHDVTSRRRELAVRMAVGADPVHIMTSTTGRAVSMVGIGLAAGGLLSLAAKAPLGALAGGGQPDILSVGLAVFVLVATAWIAVLPPALRAARTNAAAVLRNE